MKYTKLTTALMAGVLLITSCHKDDDKEPPSVQATIVEGTGDLTTALAEFRALLGEPLNTTPNQTTGRREVNWDGVPPAFTNNNTFPFDFFNSTDGAAPNGRKRGLILDNSTGVFRIDSTDFTDIDPSYTASFDAFSPKRLFISVGTNITEAIFKVPGTATSATVKGFGVVFSDVDYSYSTTLEFFEGSKSLGVYKAPEINGKTSDFSFLGVYFPNNKITRVKITSGNGVLASGVKDVSDGGSKDLVVMDDFLYSEPVAQ
jgi:hypothetical protein